MAFHVGGPQSEFRQISTPVSHAIEMWLILLANKQNSRAHWSIFSLCYPNLLLEYYLSTLNKGPVLIKLLSLSCCGQYYLDIAFKPECRVHLLCSQFTKVTITISTWGCLESGPGGRHRLNGVISHRDQVAGTGGERRGGQSIQCSVITHIGFRFYCLALTTERADGCYLTNSY